MVSRRTDDSGELIEDSRKSIVNGEWSIVNGNTDERGHLTDDSREMTDEGHRSTTNGQRLLDIGTGTGLLSLMVAQKHAGVQLDAVEIDDQAAVQAMENVAASPFGAAITVHHGDIRNWERGSYDSIISNPPFYEKEVPSTQHGKNVAHHGEGLRLETLFHIIKEKLTANGSFYLLLPYKRRHDIDKGLQQAGLFLEKKVIVHPAIDNQPFRLLLKGGQQPTSTQIETLSIYDTARTYTPEFVSLLKDYYLYL